MLARLLIGLVQGALLFGLYQVTEFDNINTGPLAAWTLLAAYAPPLWLATAGQLSLRSGLVWGLIATALLGAMGLASGLLPDSSFNLSVLMVCLPAALFCAHHLIVPALRSGGPVAPYPHYYEAAWKSGIQLVLSLMFLGVFWIILYVGAALFNAIGIGLVEDVIENKAFVFFASSLVFALGVELTDVREGLTQGIRTVALTLLSWLLPVAVLMAAAFIVTLPLAGLSELGASLSPAGLMLAATAGLIVLINTVYQDGNEHLSGSVFLRFVMRAGCVLILPMTLVALWAVSVRIGQYGLTPERIIALTAAIIGLLYSVGYVLAQIPRQSRGGGWLPTLEATNIAAALVTTLTLVGFSTPWLNPMQLSINSQLARLNDPDIAPEDIPYRWLGWESGERGRTALEGLARSDNPQIGSRAEKALEAPYAIAPTLQGAIVFYPQGTVAPEGFGTARCYTSPCAARLIDLDQDGTDEVLVRQGATFAVYKRDSEGGWTEIGTYAPRNTCGDLSGAAQALETQVPALLPPSGPQAFTLGNRAYDFTPERHCTATEN